MIDQSVLVVAAELPNGDQLVQQTLSRTLDMIFPFLLGALCFLLSIIYKPYEINPDALFQQTMSPPRVLLLTAHPDDECFFFAPTILALRRSSLSPQTFSLCLSTGNADGMGERRKGELEHSLDILGVDEDKRWIIEHPCVIPSYNSSLVNVLFQADAR
jgi:hypothetical protein